MSAAYETKTVPALVIYRPGSPVQVILVASGRPGYYHMIVEDVTPTNREADVHRLLSRADLEQWFADSKQPVPTESLEFLQETLEPITDDLLPDPG